MYLLLGIRRLSQGHSAFSATPQKHQHYNTTILDKRLNTKGREWEESQQT